MRREGYELQVSRPEVIVREINGKRHEPLERAVIDVPDEHVGTVTQALAPRKGKVTDLRPGDAGRSIVTIEAPSRGLIGFRSLLLTATRGTALMHQHHAGWIPWAGDLPGRKGGAMIADRPGSSTGYALDNLQARGEFFLGPGEEVYEGMVVGENAKPDDMIVNVVREKQKTNIRTHAADEAIKLHAAADAHARDGHRVHRRRRARRGDALRACGCASGCCASRTGAGRTASRRRGRAPARPQAVASWMAISTARSMSSSVSTTMARRAPALALEPRLGACVGSGRAAGRGRRRAADRRRCPTVACDRRAGGRGSTAPAR